MQPEPFGLLLILIAILVSIPYLMVRLYKHYRYINTTYYQITRNPYRSLDDGQYGEYLVYKNLKKLEKDGCKFLFNLYIPKPNNQTSEIDVLLISPKGLFVFESKNYRGWIFGNQQQRNWTQTLPVGKGYESHKTKFYNPIWQNASHITHLEGVIGEGIPMHSVVVFSDECDFRDVTLTSDDASVIYQHELKSLVSEFYIHIEDDLLSPKDIANLYSQLYPYTQVSSEAKEQHISNIQEL